MILEQEDTYPGFFVDKVVGVRVEPSYSHMRSEDGGGTELCFRVVVAFGYINMDGEAAIGTDFGREWDTSEQAIWAASRYQVGAAYKADKIKEERM